MDYTPYECPEGFYCPEGTYIPIPCLVGQYCKGTMNPSPTGLCDAGYYCELIKLTTNAEKASIGGVEFCMNNDLNECWIGHKDTFLADHSNECPAGYYCPVGTYQPKPCAIGTYAPVARGTTSDDTHCLPCTEGSFCMSAGQTSASGLCEAGYYCEVRNNDKFSIPCPAGHRCTPGLNDDGKKECSVGTYQPNEIQSLCYPCPAGFYCPDQAMTLPTLCPEGKYCSGNTVTPADCPVGTFSNIQGLTAQSECQFGSFGKYYNALGMTSATSGINCDSKHKCYHAVASVSGISSATHATCSDGEICPAGTAIPLLCPPGSYMAATGPLAAQSCLSCPTDYYCPDWGTTRAGGPKPYTSYPCPAGYLCEGGAVHPSKRDNISVKLCPSGYFCDKSKGAQTSKQLCPENYYQSIEGQATCFSCPAGYMCPATGTVNPEPCPRGHYCLAPTATFASVLASGVAEVTKNPCVPGTYNSGELAQSTTDCTDCPPGKYCLGGEQSYSGLCDPGFVCTGKQSSKTPSGVF